MTRRKRRRLRALVLVLAGIALAATAALLARCRLSSPPPSCELGPTTPGIDVSYHQEAIRWPRVQEAGIQFAFIRVSDGTAVPDPRFVENWAAARRAGIRRGAYQYFRPDDSATAQADLLLAALAFDPGELPPVLDVETSGGRSPRQIADKIRVWLARVRDQLHVEPIIYTGPEFWRDGVDSADFTTQPLWLAHYTSICPTVPAPWTRWAFWQYSETGRVPGITGRVDLNVFHGTPDQLDDFARASRLSH